MDFKLSSPAFGSGSLIPSNYTCDGDNISPHLNIHGVPERAKSLALLMEDLNAPAGSECHWLLWNIPPETREVREHIVPFHAESGTNSFKKNGYSGPCPPSGIHRYLFRIYALDQKLDLPPGAEREQFERGIETHILATAELDGTYGRTNEAPM